MYIKKLEIQYFRSIYRETISDLKCLNIFSGKNDVGKSDILKALNLFFNNETDAGVPFYFEENFNFRRLEEVRKDSIKGKQYIQIKITFCRGARSEKTLPQLFTVTKKWLRNDFYPSVVTDDLANRLVAEGKVYSNRCKSSLTAYLNKMRYIYIPAIKDQETFKYILSQLRESIYNDKLLNDSKLKKSMNLLSERISDAARELNEEFELVSNIKTNISSPKSVSELYRSIEVDTITGNDTVSLDKRGDGIRVRYLPSILHYIAMNSTNMYIWGFEEPENSLEYNLALEMAQNFEENYCCKSMIFTTSHSPAFIGLKNKERTNIFRCYREGLFTHIVLLDFVDKNSTLSEELGYVKLQNTLFAEYKKRLEEMQKAKEQQDKLLIQLQGLTKPVLYTEGITDVQILKTAWSKLYSIECPFEIKSCNVLDEEAGSAAGCDVLKNFLNTTRADCPQIVIGLFDRDLEGIKAYTLNANFHEMESGWKKHKNDRAHGLLLPIPLGKEPFAKYKNLCIEFYFKEADLNKRIDGKGLKLAPLSIEPKFNGVEIETALPDELYFHHIDRTTKRIFAETIVPSLPSDSFVNFDLIFQKIGNILASS